MMRVHDNAFQSTGLKSFIELAGEGARLGFRQSMQYIAKTASDGDRLAAIEKGGSPICDIAERDAWAGTVDIYI